MSTRLRQAKGDDEGAVLLIALAFLALFGVFIAALLGQNGASFQTTKVVQLRAEKTYNVDAGIDYGVMRLQQDPTLCPNVASGVGSVTAELGATGFLVNGSVPVEVTCQTLSGSATGANGYAVIVRSSANDSLTTGNGSSKVIEGPVFVNGGFDLQKALTVKGGDLEKKGSPCAKPGNLTLIPSPPYAFVCTSAPIPDPLHALPTYPTTERTKTGSTIGGCTIFKPGLYKTAPDLGAKNYFTSGVYVFRDVGSWDIKQADVYGGEQDTNENVSVTTGAPCSTDAGAGLAPNGKGVEFIFEGTSRLTFDTQSRMELFRRVPQGAAEGTEGISVFAVGSDAPAAWKPFNSGQPVISLKNGSTPEAAFHGMIYAPTATVQLFATNDTVAQSLAGLVADKLELTSSASANALSISTRLGSGKRVIVVTARAPGAAGERDITSTAVIEVANDAAKSMRVISRRVS